MHSSSSQSVGRGLGLCLDERREREEDPHGTQNLLPVNTADSDFSGRFPPACVSFGQGQRPPAPPPEPEATRADGDGPTGGRARGDSGRRVGAAAVGGGGRAGRAAEGAEGAEGALRPRCHHIHGVGNDFPAPDTAEGRGRMTPFVDL